MKLVMSTLGILGISISLEGKVVENFEMTHNKMSYKSVLTL